MVMNDENMKIRDGVETAFVDCSYNSNLAYRPEFLSNDYRQGRKVLSSLEEELESCDEFCISVAFIKKSGIAPLLMTLKELENRGIPGKILTTDYLLFSEPKALKQLESLDNTELRMYRTSSENGGFHTKGYIFRKEEIYRIIIGSSNMTLSAITKNREWNTKIVSTQHGQMAKDILGEFNELWDDENTQKYSEFIEEYERAYIENQLINKQKALAVKSEVVEFQSYTLKPNKMQVAFVNNIIKMRSEGVQRALLLSSTGTGKTLASAFALRELSPKKALFIVHREQIARQAIESYKRVFGNTKKYGLLSGNSREFDAQYLFSTMQMMSKPEIYSRFAEDEFDVIVLDECHHAGADSYQRIMEYFKPQFWLGMTASPDTNNYDIYSIFDHEIAYEIRLEQALQEDLLCPFHYFGITDIEIDGQVFDDNAGVKNFASLVSDERVRYVIEQAEYYGFSGERVKGLIFCSCKAEARELSAGFNRHGYRTDVLTGDDSQENRERVIDRLTDDNDKNGQLDYIFTVDIFNEGVDVPEINQVIMLRPTQSPVVFIQQLGRGLRKYRDKEYVVILDFIGNYMNNFMIPIALSGDKSYNKDAMRRYVREGSRVIPGSSTIHFDEVSRKRIYSSIDAARTNDLKLIKESYQNLKNKIGSIPTINEFKKYASIDVTKIFYKCGSYHNFLKKYEKDYDVVLNGEEETIIEYLSTKVASYKRVHELALLKHLMGQNERAFAYFKGFMKRMYNIDVTPQVEESVVRNLTNQFPKEDEKKKFASCVLIEEYADNIDEKGNKGYRLSHHFQSLLTDAAFAHMVYELVDFGIARYFEEYSERYKDTNFQLYQKYTYEDVCRLLNWQNNMNAQNIGGYFYDTGTKTLPVFINYDKADDAIAYEDRFVSAGRLIALSKHPRKITSSDAVHIYKKSEQDKGNRIFLFVRKNKDDNEAKEFYFLGEIEAVGEPVPIHMESTNDNAFEILYDLDVEVRSDIYDYIVGE